jgi:hypothetical protein
MMSKLNQFCRQKKSKLLCSKIIVSIVDAVEHIDEGLGLGFIRKVDQDLA